jgi:hypothetical protein
VGRLWDPDRVSTPWPAPQRPDLYVDEVEYVVRVTPHPSGRSEHVTEGYVVWWNEVGVGLDEATRIVPGVAWNSEAGHFEPHVARQSYSQFEWGASGYGLQFVVDLANNMTAEAVMLGLGYVVARLRGKKQRQNPVPDFDDIETVSVEARRAVASVFDEEWDEISVLETDVAGVTAIVTLTGNRGRYRATVGQLDETGDPYCRVQRL